MVAAEVLSAGLTDCYATCALSAPCCSSLYGMGIGRRPRLWSLAPSHNHGPCEFLVPDQGPGVLEVGSWLGGKLKGGLHLRPPQGL